MGSGAYTALNEVDELKPKPSGKCRCDGLRDNNLEGRREGLTRVPRKAAAKMTACPGVRVAPAASVTMYVAPMYVVPMYVP